MAFLYTLFLVKSPVFRLQSQFSLENHHFSCLKPPENSTFLWLSLRQQVMTCGWVTGWLSRLLRWVNWEDTTGLLYWLVVVCFLVTTSPTKEMVVKWDFLVTTRWFLSPYIGWLWFFLDHYKVVPQFGPANLVQISPISLGLMNGG